MEETVRVRSPKSLRREKPRSLATRCEERIVWSSNMGSSSQLLAMQGNTVSRNARDKEDPAVKIARDGVSFTVVRLVIWITLTTDALDPQNDVVKLAHELNEVRDAA